MRFFGIGFLVLIFLEIMSIVWVADWLGGGITLLLMIVSFVAGVMMLRNTGLSGILLAGAAMLQSDDLMAAMVAGMSKQTPEFKN